MRINNKLKPFKRRSWNSAIKRDKWARDVHGHTSFGVHVRPSPTVLFFVSVRVRWKLKIWKNATCCFESVTRANTNNGTFTIQFMKTEDQGIENWWKFDLFWFSYILRFVWQFTGGECYLISTNYKGLFNKFCDVKSGITKLHSCIVCHVKFWFWYESTYENSIQGVNKSYE